MLFVTFYFHFQLLDNSYKNEVEEYEIHQGYCQCVSGQTCIFQCNFKD